MSKFNIGDKVRLNSEQEESSFNGVLEVTCVVGRESNLRFAIDGIRYDFYYTCKNENEDSIFQVAEDELNIVVEPLHKVGDVIDYDGTKHKIVGFVNGTWIVDSKAYQPLIEDNGWEETEKLNEIGEYTAKRYELAMQTLKNDKRIEELTAEYTRMKNANKKNGIRVDIIKKIVEEGE